jgi:hypothetical protein
MRLRDQTPTRLEFVGHNPLGGVVVMAVAGGMALLAWRAEGTAATVALGLTGLFGLLGLVAVFQRDSLRFDLGKGSWARTRGLWPFLKSTTGSTSDLRGVEVAEEHGYHRGQPRVEWEVWLRSSAAAAEIRLLETSDAEAAEESCARFARLFQLESRRAA